MNYPDLTDLFTMAFHWFFYVLDWGFTLFGVSISIESFLIGCALFGLVVMFLKWMATGDIKLKLLGIISSGFGG